MTKSIREPAYKHSTDDKKSMSDIDDIDINSSHQKITKSNLIKSRKLKKKNKLISQLNKEPADANARHAAQPAIGAMAIDKLYLDLLVPEYELEAVLARAQQLRGDRQLRKGSTKGTFFKHAFYIKLPSGAVARFHIMPNNPDKGAPMQMVLNPNQMESGDCKHLVAIFKRLFPFNARETAALMLIRRIDVCIALGIAIEDFIIDLDGVMAGAKVYAATDRGGQIQTIYMGSQQSAHHGAAYDQIASDKYKGLVGEKLSRTNMRNDAELVLESELKTGRTQLESRRVFDQPTTLAGLAIMKTPFSKYRILQLETDGQTWDPAFSGYIDSVRLRGIYGARKHWQKQCGSSRKGNREVMVQITEFEQRLGRMAVRWWKPDDYAASLLETLRKSAAWKFLKVMQC